jgi:hypothetical protein
VRVYAVGVVGAGRWRRRGRCECVQYAVAEGRGGEGEGRFLILQGRLFVSYRMTSISSPTTASLALMSQNYGPLCKRMEQESGSIERL